jgi:hypothetical protein
MLIIIETDEPRMTPRYFGRKLEELLLIQVEIGRFAPKYQEPNFGPTEVVITNREPKRDVSGQFDSKVLN